MAKVDIDEQNDLACQYNVRVTCPGEFSQNKDSSLQVRSVPTVLGIKNGKVVEQFIGLADDDKIKGLVEKLLNWICGDWYFQVHSAMKMTRFSW